MIRVGSDWMTKHEIEKSGDSKGREACVEEATYTD